MARSMSLASQVSFVVGRNGAQADVIVGDNSISRAQHRRLLWPATLVSWIYSACESTRRLPACTFIARNVLVVRTQQRGVLDGVQAWPSDPVGAGRDRIG